MSLNAGEIVELAVRRKGLSISELSRRMHVNRRSVYNWFQQKALKTELIYEIGSIIEYDFSKDIPNDFLVPAERSEPLIKSERKGDPDASQSIQFWMAKYITLLEKYNQLLEDEDELVTNNHHKS